METTLTKASPFLRFRTRAAAILRSQGVLIGLVLIIVVASVMEPAFLTAGNLLNILRQSAAIGIVSLGVTFVMMTGGMDLAVGSIVSLCSLVAVSLMNRYGQAPGSDGTALAAILAVAAIGFAVGAISGSILAFFDGRLGETFIITYGMQIVVASLALLYTGGQFVAGTFGDGLYQRIGMGSTPILCFLALAAVMHVVLAYTRFGKQISFIGANIDCARMSGIKVGKLRVITYGDLRRLRGPRLDHRVLARVLRIAPPGERLRARRHRGGGRRRHEPDGRHGRHRQHRHRRPRAQRPRERAERHRRGGERPAPLQGSHHPRRGRARHVEQGRAAGGERQMSGNATKRPRLLELAMDQTVLFLLVGFVAFMAIAKPSFLAWWNVKNVLIDVSIYGVVACGMTMLIICGEFDLSASSQYMWAQILFVSLLNSTGNPALSVALTLCSGLVLGTINGVIVTRFRINSFIATLGTMTMIRGLCLVFTEGKMVSTQNAFIKALGEAEFLGLSSLFYIYVAVLAIVSVVLAYTNFGRRIYATGGNIEVARLAGIDTDREKTAAFSIMGLLCGIAGVMLVAQLRAGSTQYGNDLALTCVAATVIGGTRLSGGAGNALRTALGMLVIVVLYKALIYLGLQAYYQNLVKGLVLILVVVFDLFVSRRRAASR